MILNGSFSSFDSERLHFHFSIFFFNPPSFFPPQSKNEVLRFLTTRVARELNDTSSIRLFSCFLNKKSAFFYIFSVLRSHNHQRDTKKRFVKKRDSRRKFSREEKNCWQKNCWQKIADTKKFCKEKSEIFAEKRYCWVRNMTVVESLAKKEKPKRSKVQCAMDEIIVSEQNYLMKLKELVEVNYDRRWRHNRTS